MTREEAIKQCEDFIKHHSDWSVEVEWANGVEFVLDDYKRLIKQESVIDKIRAEISALKSHHINDCYDDGFQGCRRSVLEIFDEYKAESEE